MGGDALGMPGAAGRIGLRNVPHRVTALPAPRNQGFHTSENDSTPTGRVGRTSAARRHGRCRPTPTTGQQGPIGSRDALGRKLSRPLGVGRRTWEEGLGGGMVAVNGRRSSLPRVVDTHGRERSRSALLWHPLPSKDERNLPSIKSHRRAGSVPSYIRHESWWAGVSHRVRSSAPGHGPTSAETTPAT